MLLKLPADIIGIEKGLDKIERQLEIYGLKKSEITKTMLVSGELMTSLINNSHREGHMQLRIKKFLGDITISISVPGEEYDFVDSFTSEISLDAEEISHETENTLRNIILSSFAADLKYKYHNNLNTVRFTVAKSKYGMFYRTLGAMLLAILFGVALKNFSTDAINLFIDGNILVPVKTMFMNALKMIVTPVVFFSIVSCVSKFSDLAEIGGIGGKVLGLYILTTLIATAVGVSIYFLFQPGNPNMVATFDNVSSISSSTIEVSLKDTIVNIVPSNFVQPFLDMDMLQIIFIAIFCGIAVGMIGNYTKILIDIFEACNELFLKITVILVKFIPVTAFASILSMILQTGMKALLSVLSIFLTFVFGIVVMIVIYALLMLIIARLNPLPFLKKYAPTMLQVFSMASSNAALPINMEVCDKKLGISSKVYSLTLPLGATLNMDGSCIYLGVFSLALAHIYSVNITGARLLSIVISIIVLSVGAPGVPGSGMISLSVLLTQLGVPLEAVGLVIGIDPLIGMLRAMSNCLGDVVACTIVAKKQKLMDMNVYRNEN